MDDLLTSEERAAYDEAVAATGFRRDKNNGAWMVVGPAGTAGQAMDGKSAVCAVTMRSGEVKTVWIVNSRRYFVNDEGVQMFVATCAPQVEEGVSA
jgi:hypothetical protein|tara:strand:+ start:451 stop:738 length:288 start_codon:yes stop_codon:yes gene_type:complete